jgi:Zn-dependent protease/predicted transcriptional regulator
MGSSIRLLTVRGIDIRVHITFPLILIFAILQFGVFAGQGVAGAIFGVIVTLLLFAIVVLHELGHAVAAQNYGVPVTQIVLLPIGGVAQLERIPEKPLQEFGIAIAGPLVNVVIAIVLYLVHLAFGIGGLTDDPTGMLMGVGQGGIDAVFNYVFAANLFLALFNLIPAFPLDGGRVLRALLATRLDYRRATAIAVSIGQSLAVLAGVWGFLEGDLFLIVIAIFVYMGAGQEGQLVELRRSLGKLSVDQAYSREAHTLNLQSTIRDAIDLTLTTFQSEFPVWDGGQLMGLLTHHRLLETLNQLGSETLVRDVMLTDVKPVSPDADLFDVQQQMAEKKLEALPVVKDGRFLGLLTVQDVSELYRIATSNPRLLSTASQN